MTQRKCLHKTEMLLNGNCIKNIRHAMKRDGVNGNSSCREATGA